MKIVMILKKKPKLIAYQYLALHDSKDLYLCESNIFLQIIAIYPNLILVKNLKKKKVHLFFCV